MNYNNRCPSSRNPIHKILKKDEKVVVDFVSEIVKKNVHKCVKKTDAWNFSSTLTYICFIPQCQQRHRKLRLQHQQLQVNVEKK